MVGRLNPAHSDSISGASLRGQGWFILSYEVSKTGYFYLELIQIPSLNTNVHFNYFFNWDKYLYVCDCDKKKGQTHNTWVRGDRQVFILMR